MMNTKAYKRYIIAPLFMLSQIAGFSYGSSIAGPVSGAMGGAGVAANDEAAQILLNPAAIPHATSLAIGYFYQGGYVAPSTRDEAWAFTVIDNTDGIFFSGGAALSRRYRSFPVLVDYLETRAEFAGSAMIASHLSLGLSLFRSELEPETGEDYTLWDSNLGLLWNPSPDWAIGAVYQNLGRHSDAIPDHMQLKDKMILGGHYIFMEQFRGRLDIGRQMEQNPDNEFDYHVGFESFIDLYLVFRFGYETDGLSDQDFYTLGAGFFGPRLKIDYAYRQNVDESSGALHSVDFRLPF